MKSSGQVNGRAEAMNTLARSARFGPIAAGLAARVACAGSCGPTTIVRDRFDYVGSISDSWKQQLLLDLLKVRYFLCDIVARVNHRGLVAALLLLLGTGAVDAGELDIRVQRRVQNDQIPSGSGMSWVAGRHFVVSDDSPYLFTLDRHYTITQRSLLLQPPADAALGPIRKAMKPDFEAMASVPRDGATWTLILGSGSLVGTREVGLLVATDGQRPPHRCDLGVLYRDLAALAGFAQGQLVNIEALAVARDTAYLFNRGNAGRNLLFQMALADLLDYVTGRRERITRIQLHEARLPQLDGTEAGFSGADYWPEIDSLVYSASVEGTENAFNDGEVRGSYLGLIPLSALRGGAVLDLTESATRLTEGGVPLMTKVESVALTQTGPTRASASLVSDNDNGRSEFFDVVISIGAAMPR